ncbi:MAG: ATP-binding cassette domain-containing protein [Hyphomicrobiales bacterium]|nr:ATP-binding cassette domain-containing protein [Hyphomicrobiales bacterium]
MKSKPYISLKNVSKVFGKNSQDIIDLVLNDIDKTTLQNDYNHIIGLQNISIDIPKNKIQVFMGLSGSGKSTLIRHLNQLIRPTYGEIIIDGVDVTKLNYKELIPFRRKNFAMVFQKFALLPHRTVLSNTYFGLQIKGIKGKELEDTAMYWIEKVGLEGFENYHPNQLSGGMQQRVGIARALANDAPIILMDEPFSALDPLIRIEMQEMLINLQKELKKTIIFITHDLDEALKLGDNISILRDGRIIQSGTGQDIILNPRDSYITNFTAQVNRGRVVECGKIMKKIAKKTISEITIEKNMKLEDVARLMISNDITEIDVTNSKKSYIGSVTLNDVISSMINPIDDQ